MATKGIDAEEVTRIKLARTVVVHRERMGVSQRELAVLCGIDRSFLNGVERGHRSPTLQALVKIADGLGTTVSMLTKGILKPEAGEVWDQDEWDRTVLDEAEREESEMGGTEEVEA